MKNRREPFSPAVPKFRPSQAGAMHFYRKLNAATGGDAIFLKI
jgi:hypothetical protein